MNKLQHDFDSLVTRDKQETPHKYTQQLHETIYETRDLVQVILDLCNEINLAQTNKPNLSEDLDMYENLDMYNGVSGGKLNELKFRFSTFNLNFNLIKPFFMDTQLMGELVFQWKSSSDLSSCQLILHSIVLEFQKYENTENEYDLFTLLSNIQLLSLSYMHLLSIRDWEEIGEDWEEIGESEV